MIKLLLDVAPWPPDRESGRIIRRTYRLVTDTIDSLAAPAQQVTDAPSGHSNLTIILGAILAALIALGICIFMVRASRKRGEQQLQLSRIKSKM